MRRKIVIGIGNPGREYEGTRHNVGWRVLDELGARTNASFGRADRLRAETAEGRLKNVNLLLVKPQTFVNRTGELVPGLRRIDEELEATLLVVCDDANLPLGRLRMRAAGSSGGHNGLQSLIDAFGHEQVARLRVGIDRVPGDPLKDYVLARFDPEEEEEVVRGAVARAADAVSEWALAGIERAMNLANREPKEEPE